MWLPGFMRQLEAAFDAFERHEQRLGKLSLRPSEYVRRQVRVTPYPTEPTGWIIENSASRDLHVQLRLPPRGGRPQSTAPFRPRSGAPAADVQERFFRLNFEDLMGTAAYVPAAAA